MSIQKLIFTKHICFLSAILLAGVSFAEAELPVPENQIIASIETVGNVTISRTQILSTVRARIGEVFDKKISDEDINRLARIEGVEYTYYNVETVEGNIKLTYVVVEKNLVRSILFNGNKKIKDKKLLSKIGFKKGDYLDVFIARKGVEEITDYYLTKGYPTVKVELDRTELLSGTVLYIIEEGTRTKVKSIEFIGNEGLKKRQVKKAVKTKKRKFFFWPAYYERETFRADADRITQEYHNKGYLDAKITGNVEFAKDNKHANISFTIEEGPLYIVENISIGGNTFFEDEELNNNLKLEPGRYYSEERSLFDLKQITGRFLEKGFVEASVEQKRTFVGPGKVDVDFNIIPGDRFRIGQINVSGNRNVHEKTVLNILDEEGFTPGQWYNAQIARGDGRGDLEKTMQRIILANATQITPSGNTPGQKDANVSFVESKTGDMSFGGGVGSNSGAFGTIMIRQRNFDIMNWPTSFEELFSGKAFTGAGQQMTISWYPGVDQTSFGIDFREPYLADMPVSFNSGISIFQREQEASDEKRKRFYLGVEKRYDDRWRRGVTLRVENVNVKSLEPDAPTEIRDVKGSNDLIGLKLNIRKDTTNSRFTPNRGYHFNASYEQVTGDFNFGVISATQRWYKTVYEDLAERKTILETKLHAATIIGNAPYFEKFYAGGSNSIRGFEYRGVSPRGTNPLTGEEGDIPIGSDWMITANTELAIPITSEVFSWLFFVDSGLIETGDVRASIGTGVQILLPQWFGPVPMRFEFAKPLMEDDQDDTQTFSFSVGALF